MDRTTGHWYEIGDEAAFRKTFQAIRDKKCRAIPTRQSTTESTTRTSCLAPLPLPLPLKPTPAVPKSQAAITEPHPHDVLNGRRAGTARNETYFELIHSCVPTYTSSTKNQKPTVVYSIVQTIRAQTPPGRFLEMDRTTGHWYEIGDVAACHKTLQAIKNKIYRDTTGSVSPRAGLGAVTPNPMTLALQARLWEQRSGSNACILQCKHCHIFCYPAEEQTYSSRTKLFQSIHDHLMGCAECPLDTRSNVKALETHRDRLASNSDSSHTSGVCHNLPAFMESFSWRYRMIQTDRKKMNRG